MSATSGKSSYVYGFENGRANLKDLGYWCDADAIEPVTPIPAPLPVPGPAYTEYVVKAGYNANVRYGPSTSYGVAYIAYANSTVRVMDYNAQTNGYTQLVDGNWITAAFIVKK